MATNNININTSTVTKRGNDNHNDTHKSGNIVHVGITPILMMSMMSILKAHEELVQVGQVLSSQIKHICRHWQLA